MTVQPLDVNAHLHTPYSFSAFDSLSEALDMAKNEGVSVVGINDFNSFDGYAEWSQECEKRKLYPLFNVEFICMQEEYRAKGILVNDPNNPGRTYISGKGLEFPIRLSGKPAEEIADVRRETNDHAKQMCDKMNELLAKINADFEINFEKVKKEFTKGDIRERHLAKALRIKIYKKFNDNASEITSFLERIFRGKKLNSHVEDTAAVENEIRGNLLKMGGAAFVVEGPKAFLPMSTVCNIILSAGGIPTYPFLADDEKDRFTDFERDVKKTVEMLKKHRIYSVEFITARNSMKVLEQYSGYLHDHGFIVTFGSEHNTPDKKPVLLSTREGAPLSKKLKKINYAGACIVAAHQNAIKNRITGYVDMNGKADAENRELWIKEGNKLIRKIVG